MGEWVKLKSTLTAIHHTRFLCTHCLNHKYPNQPDRLIKEKKALGCTVAYSETIHNADGIKYNRCIGNFYSASAASWVDYYVQWDNGVMPFEGNYFDQPAKAIEVMRMVHNYRVSWELDRAKQNEAKQNARLKRGNQ